MASVADQLRKANEYGWLLSVLRGIPELSRLFDTAVKNEWNGATFVAKLRSTKWYRIHSESYRQFEILKRADPAEYNRRRQQYRANIRDQYYALTGQNMDLKRATQAGDHAFMYGYSDAEIRDMLSAFITVTPANVRKGVGGSLGDAEKQLRTAMEDFGINFSENWVARALTNIAHQQSDVSSFTNYMRQLAISRYPGFKEQLEQGQTVRDIAEPFKQLMARTLELSDKGITVNDGLIQKALTFRPDPKSAPANGGMPLWQFEEQLRNDPRWIKTQNAQDQAMQVGRQVLQDMGMLGASG